MNFRAVRERRGEITIAKIDSASVNTTASRDAAFARDGGSDKEGPPPKVRRKVGAK